MRHQAYATGAPARRAPRRAGRSPLFAAALGSAAALAATAACVAARARKAEREHPPLGRFLDVDGVRLHYVAFGRGDPVVLLHGNGTMIEDYLLSGVADRLAARHRIILFDRPGFGYSERPRDRLWTPEAQAELIAGALDQLGVERAIVVGHSWGTLAAIALGLVAPFRVRALVLASGYYFPTMRLDVPLFSPPAIPVVGDVLRYTVSALVARLIFPGLVRRLFQPAPVTEFFARGFPSELALRPSQLRAAAADTALMVPAAMRLRHRYRDLQCPVTIVTGADDKFADVGRQSRRLHRELPGSAFVAVPGAGHMVHHLAPETVAGAIARMA